MALSKQQMKQIENINVDNFSKEFKEQLEDMFEVISYFLSEIEVRKHNGMFNGERGEA
jgi:hypothetical protein